ncbi:hypothetical protein GY45DRAFT_1046356 [Cubamyces sp. BRFM 1775]|nr:hypothetical protein GY45DRAFT_1046356 [Cubamyces sp. BRFM 1775]
MSYSEDAQPNETRHARKGDARIPAIRSSRSVISQHRGYSRGRGRGVNHSTGRGRGSFGLNGTQPWQQGAHSSQDSGSPQSSRRSGQSNPYWRASKAQRVQRGGMHSDNGWQGFQSQRVRPVSAGDTGPSEHEDAEPELEPLLATRVPTPLQAAAFKSTVTVPVLKQGNTGPQVTPQEEHQSFVPEVFQPPLPTTPTLGGHRSPWPYDPQHPSLSISLARRFFPPAFASVAATFGSPTTASQAGQFSVTPPIVAPPPNIPINVPLHTDGTSNHVNGPEPTTLEEPADAAMDVPHNDYNPEAEVIDILQDPVTTPDVEMDVVTDKPDNKAVRWGCWSALSSPPNIRSGTLVLSLSTPVRGCSADAPEPLLASRESSVLDVSPSNPSTNMAQFVSVRDASDDNVNGEEDSGTVGQHERIRAVQLRKDAHDKPRRLLALPGRGLLNVTMRGSLDLIEGLHSQRAVELTTSRVMEASRHVADDACVLSPSEAPIVVLGHARSSQQLSLIRLEGRRVGPRASCTMTPRSHKQYRRRPWEPSIDRHRARRTAASALYAP